MSRKKLNAGNLIAYSNKDFDNTDRLNKIRMYMIEPGKFELDGEDWEYYILLEGCFHLITSELSKQVGINKIKATYPDLSHHQAIMAFHNTTELFGDLVDNNRQIQKGKLVERLAILADKAFENAIFKVQVEDENGNKTEEERVSAEWMEMYRRLSKDIAELEAYDKQRLELDPDKIHIPKLIITSDPQAFLRSRNVDNDESE